MLRLEEITPNLSAGSYKTGNYKLNAMFKAFGSVNIDIFNKDTYNDLTFLDKADELFATREYSASTVATNHSMLLKLANHFGAPRSIVEQIVEIVKEKRNNAVGTSKVEAISLDKARQMVTDKLAFLKPGCYNLHLLGHLVLSDLAGVRLSDVVNTRLVDSEKHFLDLDNKVWHIRAPHTKNREARSFAVPDDFIEAVKKYGGNNYILTNRMGGETTAKICGTSFASVFGFNYGQLRKGACEAVFDDADSITEVAEHANVMGHSVQTELTHYVADTQVFSTVIRRSDGKQFVLRRKT